MEEWNFLVSYCWLTFLETLKTTESQIIEADEHLSGQEKEDERKLYEERIRELTEKQEMSKKEVLQEQQRFWQDHYEKLAMEREKKIKEEMERYQAILEAKFSKAEIEEEMERLRNKYENMREQARKLNVDLLETREAMNRMEQKERERKSKGLFGRLYDAFCNN